MRILALLVFAAAVHADVVVLKDRTVVDGPVTRDGEILRAGEEEIPLRRVLLWEGDDGVARMPVSMRSHYRALRILADREALRLCRERLPQAVEQKAGETARLLLARAESGGMPAQEAERWDAKIDRLEARTAEGIAVPGPDVFTDLLVDRAAKAKGKDPVLRAYQLLRTALKRDAKHAGALATVDTWAYKYWPGRRTRPKEEWQPHWLDWKVLVLAEGVRLARRKSVPMDRARTIWGRTEDGRVPDLWGLKMDEMSFVTSYEDPGPVRMCVQYARLTCRKLAEMFRIDEPKRLEEDDNPLVVYLYKDKDEYVRLSRAGVGGGAAADLGLTAGHYIPSENVSRFFWPDRPDAYNDVRDTFVHELTHHWIERRNPRWHAKDLAEPAERVQMPGYWIAEGFAVFSQESRFDVEKGAWTNFNPHAFTLDVVAAAAKQNKLIPWSEVYPLTQMEFHGPLKATATKLHVTMDLRWQLGRQPMSKIVLFYQQSGATCHFLFWGENGKYRERLLDYVTNFYTSQPGKTEIEAAFGLTPAELGKKVEAFAKAVIAGEWRPPAK